jgi:phosphatidylinositol alpha-1,6-mannosyltransferase
MAHGTEIVGAQGRAEASMRRAVRSMDLVVANSDYTAGQVEARIPGCPPVEVLCPGVDIGPPSADLGEVRDRLGLGAGPVVLTAARLVTRKGHVEFARHWPGIEARVPGAQWVVAGDGPRADELRAAATSSVKMVGAVDADTLRALYALADVHLLPGLPSAEVEGFGMAIVEAGAAGTPSVASDLGGTGEALGGGGVLVPGGDMAAMAEAVTELLTDAPRRMDLAGRARRRAEELAWDRVGERFRRIIGERVG